VLIPFLAFQLILRNNMGHLNTIRIAAQTETCPVRSSPPIQRVIVVVKFSTVRSARPELILDPFDGFSQTRFAQKRLMPFFTASKKTCFIDVAASLASKHFDLIPL
jgi:hypothetical protein